MTSQINIELDEDDINQAVSSFIHEHFGVKIPAGDVKLEVKSKQNYKSEWEQASYRAKFLVLRRDEE